MPRRAKTTRLFNGRLFTLRYRTVDRTEAGRLANEIKKQGLRARIIPTARGTYWVWQGPKL